MQARRFSRRALLLASAAGLATVVAGCGEQSGSGNISVPALAYPDDSIFTTTGRVAERMQTANLRILDCSELQQYRRGHLPGALHVWWQETIEVHNPVYGMLVNPNGRQELARNAGIDPESEVVCYDDDGGVYAARIAWTLRYMGFRNTSILPGGTQSWRAAGHQLTRRQPDIPEGNLPDIFDESIVAHPRDILARLDEPGLVILDSRTESERDETWNGRLRQGIIPGSVWLPRERWLEDERYPVPADILQDRLAEVLNPDETAEIIVYGLHGTLAALPYYMLQALNRYQVRLYDGSWAQWGADATLPLEPINP